MRSIATVKVKVEQVTSDSIDYILAFTPCAESTGDAACSADARAPVAYESGFVALLAAAASIEAKTIDGGVYLLAELDDCNIVACEVLTLDKVWVGNHRRRRVRKIGAKGIGEGYRGGARVTEDAVGCGEEVLTGCQERTAAHADAGNIGKTYSGLSGEVIVGSA